VSSGRLYVYLNNELTGVLWLDPKKYFTFQYSKTWYSREEAIPISLSLPLSSEAYENDRARPFFANLLPEEKIRQAISRTLGISAKNDFALLEAIGGECAGAISVWPTERQVALQESYRHLPLTELERLTEAMPARPILIAGDGVRLSLAGAQNKVPVYMDGKEVFLPEGGASSSHILKPQIRELHETVENEAFCMMLAQRVGLPVPKAEVLPIGETTAYLVERYDRVRGTNGQLLRIHQEDFCQALRYLPTEKYEGEGGPSFAKCFRLIATQSTSALKDQIALIRWLAFNLLVGNSDAHAKNISLLFTDGGIQLAPFYDLMSTVIYPRLTRKIAMHVGNATTFDELDEQSFEKLASDAGIRAKIIFQTLQAMSLTVPKAAAELKTEFVARHGAKDIIDTIVDVISRNSHKLSALAKQA